MSALVTASHCKVVEFPAVIVVAVAVNEKAFGVPLHPDAGGGGGFSAGAPGTVIFTLNVVPNNAPLGLFKRQ
jgi:hypothetical protein